MTRSRETGDVGYRAYKKNFLINGGFLLWQRNISFPSGGTRYTADRWVTLTDNSVDLILDTPPEGSSAYSMEITGSSGARPIIYQGVELPAAGVAGVFRQGRTFSISFWFDGLAVGQLVSLRGAFVDSVASSTNRVVAVPDFTIATSTGAGWQYATATFTIDAVDPVGSSVAFEIYLLGSVADTTMRLSEVQLEEGSSATSFEYVSPQENLAACQRYFQQLDMQFSNYGVTASGNSQHIPFAVQMRTIPDVLNKDTSGSTNSANANVTAARSDNYVISGSAIAQGWMRIAVSAQFDAEL